MKYICNECLRLDLALNLNYCPCLHFSAFKEVFDLFDSNGGGTIDAEELDLALRSVDIQLSQEEIIDVLTTMDKDGKNGPPAKKFNTRTYGNRTLDHPIVAREQRLIQDFCSGVTTIL